MHPRLHVILAAAAPRAAVIRRGPTDWVRVSQWHTDTDTFDHGSWFHGRLHERRCDISPDGQLLVGFFRKDNARPDAKAESWLSVSRLPWLHSLALWWVGSAWSSGGVFMEDGSLWTGYGQDVPDEGSLPSWLRLSTQSPVVDGTNNWTDRTVPVNQLRRGGWHRDESARVETWRRDCGDGRGLVRVDPGVDATGGSFRWPVEFAVDDGTELHLLSGAAWADVDHRGRIVVAREGRIERWADGQYAVLEDFNDQQPDPQPPPAAARRWPTGN